MLHLQFVKCVWKVKKEMSKHFVDSRFTRRHHESSACDGQTGLNVLSENLQFKSPIIRQKKRCAVV